jgi:hypothetical protein
MPIDSEKHIKFLLNYLDTIWSWSSHSYVKIETEEI